MSLYPSIQDITRSVLQEVEAEQRVKTAAAQTAMNGTEEMCQTTLGRDLQKLAAACRLEAQRPVHVTINDVQGFIERCQNL